VDEEALADFEASKTFAMTADAELATAIREEISRHKQVFGPLDDKPALVDPMPVDWLQGAEYLKSQSPRRVTPVIREAMEKAVEELLDLGIIRYSNASYASPVVMVRKPSGGFRMCIDYSQVNRHTVNFVFPLPNTRELLDRMAGHQYYIVMDLKSGYYQFPLRIGDEAKTAFQTPDAVYEFTRIPMGMKNAPSWFQAEMAKVLRGLAGVELYIDDLIVVGDTKEELLLNFSATLDRLQQCQIHVNPDKCQFGLEEVTYLGHQIGRKGIAISPKRRQALSQLPVPTNTKSLRQFVGAMTYVSWFIEDFALVARPLHRLCSDQVPFTWGQGEQQAYETLKQAVQQAPLLAHLNYAKAIFIQTDASDVGMGAMIYQKDEGGRILPVSFLSKAFTGSKLNWSAVEKECYAIVYAMLHWQHFTYGYHVTIRTDNRALTWLKKSTVPKLLRWRMLLDSFDYSIDHVPGIDNVLCDALSRQPIHTVQVGDALVDDDDFNEVIALFHNERVGHGGITATVEKLRAAGHDWAGMPGDVAEYLHTCAVCQKQKVTAKESDREPRSISSWDVFDSISIDTVGPFQTSEQGNTYALVAICNFSRMVEIIPLKDLTAETAARALLQIYARYGAPRTIRFDGGRQFDNKLLSEFAELINTKQVKTIPYRPQSNGMVERANKEVVAHLKALVYELRDVDNWDVYVPLVQRIVNATFHTAIGCSPARLLYGGRIDLNRHLLAQQEEGEAKYSTMNQWLKQAAEVEHKIHLAAIRHLEQTIVDRKREMGGKAQEFAPGSFVLLRHPSVGPFAGKGKHKLVMRAVGPRRVKSQTGNWITLENFADGTETVFDISRVVPFAIPKTLQSEEAILKFVKEEAAKDLQEYYVESILDHSGSVKKKTEMKFLVKWADYGADQSTWESFATVRDCEALDIYAASTPGLQSLASK